MTDFDLMLKLRNNGIVLRAEGDRLICNAPRGALTPELRGILKEQKTEILQLIRQAEKSNQPEVPPIPKSSFDEDPPMSFGQQRLWFLEQLQPGSSAYNMSWALRIDGELHSDLFEDSLNEVIKRHEALRTTFDLVSDKPVQVIDPCLRVNITKVDFKPSCQSMLDQELCRIFEREAKRPFDFKRGPLIRASLFQTDANRFVFFFAIHHIVFDGWSFDIFVTELFSIYLALVSGQAYSLPALPIQYADYANWQQNLLPQVYLSSQLSYWKKKLAGAPSTTLPLDFHRPEIQSFHGAQETIEVPRDLADTLKKLSRSEGVSFFNLLLSVFTILLSRYNGENDVCVGIPSAGRKEKETESLIGFFIQTLAIRTDLSGNPGFAEVVRQVQDVVLEAQANQDIPFEKIVEELAPKRTLSTTPIFQIFFNHITTQLKSRGNINGINIEPFTPYQGELDSKFDLTFYVRELGDTVWLATVYNTDLFSRERMVALLEQYRYLLEQVAFDAQKPIESYSLVTPISRALLPHPETLMEAPPQTLLTDMIASWVVRTPDRTAVTQGDLTLTYRELFQRSQVLAKTLKLKGAEPGDVVAIYCPRSFGLVVSMLAVLLNRNVLLLIDQKLPDQRKQLIIREAGARYLLRIEEGDSPTEQKDKDPFSDIQFIKLDTNGLVAAPDDPELETVTLPELNSEDAAYIFFTSGTTGRPKAVLGTNKGLSHFITWQRETFGITPDDRVAQFTSLSFDPVLREIFLPLTTGATLCLPENLDILASDDVFSWLGKERISILHTVPSLAQSWLATAVAKYPPSGLRYLFFAGEPLTSNLVQKWRSAFPDTEVVNLYGPTETTLAKCFYRVKADALRHGVQPLGNPMPQTQALVLGRDNQLCGIGESGEIVLRTPFRSLGYLNNEKENQKHFRKNPFSADETDYLYFTGDRGRYLPDGMLEYLGRVDDQIKIRGVRVEPNEIAVTIAEHPMVHSCFVMKRENEQGQPYLAAYVVVKEQNELTVPELRTHIQQRLPAVMVPEAYVFLDTLPVTPRGKIDRRALPAPDRTRPELGDFFEAPRNQSEELVAGIWSDVLHRDHIGIRDNFFDLGGHSLLVMQVISRIRETFQTEIALRTLFETPTVAGLSACIEAANDSEKRLQTPPPLHTTPRDGALELSFAQQRLWFLHHLEPDSVAYSILSSVRLSGELDQKALEQAFIEIARRHETLRTTFGIADGKPILVIGNDPNLLFESIDLSHLPVSGRETKAMQLAKEDAAKPFDLACGPLLRLLLFRLADHEHVMHINMHHIISDFWSLKVMAQELEAIYTSFVRKEPLRLPELPIQYADFAHWQRQWLQGEALAAQLSYWKEKLGGGIEPLELPTDRPRTATQTHRGAVESIELPQNLVESARQLSRREGASLFMVLLTVFKVLLYRLTGHEDIAVGTPISGRNRMELERLIGFFMNTIVMRSDLSGEPPFQDLLGRVRETALEAYAYQEVPFEKLVEELAPVRDLSRTPFFQIFFNYIVADDNRLALPGLQVDGFGQMERESKFDMTLYVGENNGEITLTALYNTDLFDADRIAVMLRQFEVLLKQAVENPTECINRYTLLTSSDKIHLPDPAEALAPQWAGTVHERFSEQAGSAPDRTAIVAATGNWTYGELERCSNRLAGHLHAKGIQPSDVVAVYTQRSPGLVVALLGILKAGAAFLILDADYPAARLTKILQAAGPAGLLSLGEFHAGDEEFSEILEDSGFKIRLQIPQSKEAMEAFLSGLGGTIPEVMVGPEDTAYLIFTSGTTGDPKGILGTHRPLSHFMDWHIQRHEFDASDRFSMLSGLSHDPLLRDIFAPLCAGASLHIPEPEQIMSPDRFREWMEAQEISVAHMTPALCQVLTTGLRRAEGAVSSLPALHHIFFGGDILTGQHVESIRWIAPRVACVNFYGTTETPQAMGYHVVTDNEGLDGSRRIPIGHGIDGAQLLILNAAGHLAGIGELGEIHVRTPYLTRGYLNDPDLTRERYIQNPYSGEGDDRLYRTGDLGRYMTDGGVMFLGRRDSQISIRGFRIETGEIEATIKEMDAVSNCVVILREDAPDVHQLSAYYVLKPGHHDAVHDFKGYIRSKLPDYMVPRHFVELQAIPLTPNGKIDVKALPKPEADGSLEQGYVAPRFSSEYFLAEIWSTVLGIPQVGIHDNFFDLGGHSLLAVQMISRISQALDIDVVLRDLFEHPTVAQLAAWIDDLGSRGGTLRLPQIKAVTRSQPLALSFAQERLWFLQQLEPESTAYNMPSLFRMRGRLDLQSLQKSIDALARRYETLRTTFKFDAEQPMQVIADEVDLPIKVLDLRDLAEDQREAQTLRYADEYSRKPFDLATGPLFWIVVFQLADDDHIMLVNMHHIISDYWSFGIMGREIARLYSAYVEGQEPQLDDLPVQYADFACCQRNWLQGDVLEIHLAYWKEKLGRELTPLELPLDRPRPAIQTHNGADCSIDLAPKLIEELKKIGRKAGASLFMVLLAAFKLLLHRLSGRSDIVVGSPVSGRNRLELEGLIGFFINTLVMRTDLSGNPAFGVLLERVRETALGAYAHQELPFEKLVEVLAPQRDLSRTPLFQVFFNHIRVNEQPNALPGLAVEATGAIERDAKFDLTLYVWEQNAGISLRALYNADLFTAERMAAMLEQYKGLLEQVAAHPDREIDSYLLTREKDSAVLPEPSLVLERGWSGPVTQRLAHWAQVQCQDIALKDRWGSYSYGQLEQLSNRLGNRLVSSGIAPGDVVAVYGHRSAGLVLALLGIMKAGAAFLILDSGYPADRLVRMIEEAGPRGLVALEAAGAMGKELSSRPYACQLILPRAKEQVQELLAGDSDGPPAVTLDPDQIAYIIFTSGSTGRPKGIVGTHRPLSHFIQWHCDWFGFGVSDRFSMLSGLAHDPLLRDIFTPLWAGARLCIPKPVEMLMPAQLRHWMREQKITVSHMTPALGQVLTQGFQSPGDSEEPLAALHHVFFGGDVLTESQVAGIRSVAPGVECVNFYGTTETPQAMGYHVLATDENSYAGKRIPLGRGIEGAQLLILNTAGQLAGIGELGEIHVRTPYLAKGYLEDKDLTAAKFFQNPYTKGAQDRMYKTGDLGRYMPDGAVMFYGRRDNQVSIRGFRIELGEIEGIIKELTVVANSVVSLRKVGNGEQQLFAYYVLNSGHDGALPDFKGYVRSKLPEYMVPQHFVELSDIPLTPNGKLDLARLPVHKEERSEVFSPRTLLETQLVAIWENVLGVSGVGLRDNFFDLGGHSLLVLTLLDQMEKVFKRRFPLSSIFQAQTIEAMAAAMTENSLEFGGSLVAIQLGRDRQPLFIIPGVGGSALGYNELARLLGAEQPVYCLQSVGLDGLRAPLDRIEDIASHFCDEIRKVQPDGPYHIAGFCVGGGVAFEIAQQLTAQGQSVATLVLVQTFSPNRARGNYKVPVVFHQLVFATRSILRNLRSLKDVGLGQWFRNFRNKSRIVKEIVRTRDIYRGDRTQLYWELVQRANLRAFSRYSPDSYKGSILFIMPSQRDLTGRVDPKVYWGNLAEQGLKYRELSGEDSGSLLKKPNVQALAEVLSNQLEKTGACS
jgi:amino acid adenylation domain-containing protein